MLQRPNPLARWFHDLHPAVPFVCSLCFVTGCGPSAAERNVRVDEPPAFTVRIERSQDAAARAALDHEEQKPPILPRALAFTVVGAAPKPDAHAQAEERIAATQAAIIEAFSRALIEARQARRQSTENFTARLGPRMTVTQQSDGATSEVRITLFYRGVENTLVVRDGVLQHPPVDLRLIRRLFEETNGEFSLLATDTTSNDEVATATVACYLPAGFDPAVKLHVAKSDDDTP